MYLVRVHLAVQQHTPLGVLGLCVAEGLPYLTVEKKGGIGDNIRDTFIQAGLNEVSPEAQNQLWRASDKGVSFSPTLVKKRYHCHF